MLVTVRDIYTQGRKDPGLDVARAAKFGTLGPSI